MTEGENIQEAILALSSNGTLNNADTATDLRALTGGSASWVAVLRGYNAAGDGGGGLFYWSTTAKADDGGTSLNSGGLGSSSCGWRRIYSGALNVRWFGAASDSSIDQGPIIQRVLNLAVAQSYYPAVYLPAGQYNVKTTVLIPRRESRGLTITGDGRNASIINGLALAEADPVVSFDLAKHASVNLKIEDLSFQRDNKGAVFIHQPSCETCKLQSAVLRNLTFNVPDGYAYTQHAALYIDGARYGHFENLTCTGGESAFVLKDSSYCTVQDFTTNGDHRQKLGIRMIGGAHHVFKNIHVDACGVDTSYGIGFSMENGGMERPPTAILIDTISFEGGKSTSPQIKILSGKSITIINPAIGAGGTNNNQIGVLIGDGASGVRIIGGWMQGMNSLPHQGSNQTLYIAAGADGVLIDGTVLEGSNNLAADVSIDPSAQGVRVNFMVKPNANAACYPYTKTAGTTHTLSVNNKTAWVQGYGYHGGDIWNMPTAAVNTLNGGYLGQIITILSVAGANGLTTGGNLKFLQGSTGFNPNDDVSAIRFIYDGTYWREVSRSNNA